MICNTISQRYFFLSFFVTCTQSISANFTIMYRKNSEDTGRNKTILQKLLAREMFENSAKC